MASGVRSTVKTGRSVPRDPGTMEVTVYSCPHATK